MDTTRATGSWLYRGILYRDVLVRITIDSPNPEAASAFLRDYKQTLKKRFEQLDIWITAHDVEVI